MQSCSSLPVVLFVCGHRSDIKRMHLLFEVLLSWVSQGGTEFLFFSFSHVVSVASVSCACPTFQTTPRLPDDAREEGIGGIVMSVVQGATWCLSRMLLFIMSASCYRSAGYGGDSFVDTELPLQPRPAEVCLAGAVPASHSPLSFRDWISKPPGDDRQPLQVTMSIVLRREWLRLRPAPAPLGSDSVPSDGSVRRRGNQETPASGKHHFGNFDVLLGCCRRAQGCGIQESGPSFLLLLF